MTKKKPGRKPSLSRRGKVLMNLQLTRWRQKAWKEKPEVMEQIRKKATQRAKAVKEERNKRLMSHLAELPKTMTTQELDDLFVKDYCQRREVSRASFFMRIKRRGLLSYDFKDGLWVNNCK
jgi:hypothetical protein